MDNGIKPSPLNKIDVVEFAEANSIQDRKRKTTVLLGGGEVWERSALLPAWGTKERDNALWRLSHDPFNTMFPSASAGIIKKIQSTPYQIKAPHEYGDYWQRMLADADLGEGWARFIGRVVNDFLRYDCGAFVEIIASGDPSEPIASPVIGIANLDPLKCWFSGDSEYPVIYWSETGDMHYLHRTRVYHIVDMPDSTQYRRGFGTCALSRAIAPVYQEIYLQKYMVQSFDDNPPPGFVSFTHMTKADAQSIIREYRETRQTDSGGVFGRIIPLYPADSDTKPSVEFTAFSNPPERFNYQETINIIARQMANAFNVDLNEFWELTGGNIGSSTQAEIMAQKSKGKLIGFLLRELERFVNDILPIDCTFEFKYRDEVEENARADIASKWVSLIASAQDLLSVDEKRRLLVENVEALRDVLTDADGVILPRNDFDRQTNDELSIEDTYNSNNDDDASSLEDTDKAFLETAGAFAVRLSQFVRSYINRTADKVFTRIGLRSTLSVEGESAFVDGKIAGGDTMPVKFTADDELALATWRNEQDDYINGLLDEVQANKVTIADLDSRIPLWVNKSLKRAYHLGLASTNRNKFYMWALGNTIDHCPTCLMANGQVHRMRAWVKAGVLPQGDDLACGGWNCDCKLEPVATPRLFGKGNLQAVKRTLKRHKHHH